MNNDELETGNAKADELRARMEQLQSKLRVAKAAYFNRTELDGKIPEYEDLAGIAKDLISANYQLQKELYGKVKLKLSVSKLLRATSR
jgi:hypothetical protein